jgi:hypothetical protein
MTLSLTVADRMRNVLGEGPSVVDLGVLAQTLAGLLMNSACERREAPSNGWTQG